MLVHIIRQYHGIPFTIILFFIINTSYSCVIGERPLGRRRHRWEDNIKMDLQEVGGSRGDWMELAQDRDRWRALVGTVRNLRVPKRWGIS